VELDRRGFLRLAGGALLVGGAAPAPGRPAAAPPTIHERTRNTRLGALGRRRRGPDEAGPWKTYAGAERVALPPPGPGGSLSLAAVLRSYGPTSGFGPEPLSAAALARLLFLGNGVTGRAGATLLRAAPSAGALYAGEVYVVTERVSDLAPGVYYYEVAGQSLARIRSGSFLGALGEALEEPAALEGAAVAVVLTNRFLRYTSRYRNRGYRYALIDSGHIGENLRLSARAAGLGETAPLRFHDDAVAALLGVDGSEEAVCAIHAMGEPGGGGARPAPRRFAERQLAEPAGLESVDPLTRRYHEATKLVPAAGSPAPPAAIPPAAARVEGPASSLPRRDGPPFGVDQAIRQRRSARRFEPGSVGLSELTFLLESARGHLALERAPGVDLYVVAHRLQGAEPGLYRYEPEGHQLTGLRPGDLGGELRRACNGQSKVAEAAGAVILVARFEPGRSGLGTRLYRDQLLEAGAVAQRIYLAAEAAGLTARNLAAFIDDDLNALVGLDVGHAGAIHLTAFGPGD